MSCWRYDVVWNGANKTVDGCNEMRLAHGVIEEVANGLFVATPNPGEGTMGVIVTSKGKIAIDTTSYNGFARMVMDAIDAHYRGPWRFVINTHSHFDHVGGNEVFDAPIVANTLTETAMREFSPQWIKENVQRWIKKGLLDEKLLQSPRIVMPHIVYENSLTIRLDNLSLHVTRLGGHSEDSSVVYIPERQTLYAADLVFSGREAGTTGADLEQWRQSLDQLQKLEAQTVVAGHGPPGGRELLTSQRDEINTLIANQMKNNVPDS